MSVTFIRIETPGDALWVTPQPAYSNNPAILVPHCSNGVPFPGSASLWARAFPELQSEYMQQVRKGYVQLGVPVRLYSKALDVIFILFPIKRTPNDKYHADSLRNCVQWVLENNCWDAFTMVKMGVTPKKGYGFDNDRLLDYLIEEFSKLGSRAQVRIIVNESDTQRRRDIRVVNLSRITHIAPGTALVPAIKPPVAGYIREDLLVGLSL